MMNGFEQELELKNDELLLMILNTSDMAYEAAVKAIENAKISPEEIDLILLQRLHLIIRFHLYLV